MLAPPNVDSDTDATTLAYSRIEQTLLGIVIWLVVRSTLLTSSCLDINQSLIPLYKAHTRAEYPCFTFDA